MSTPDATQKTKDPKDKTQLALEPIIFQHFVHTGCLFFGYINKKILHIVPLRSLLDKTTNQKIMLATALLALS